MAKSKRSRRVSSSCDSNSSPSDSDFVSSNSEISLSEFHDAKASKFVFKKSKFLAKSYISGIDDKHTKVAREAFKPSVEKFSKKYDASNIFANPRLDEALCSVLKSAKNSSASVANIDALEKTCRRHTNLTFNLGKAVSFLNKAYHKKNLPVLAP